jgi:hypothetical protein
MTFNDEPDWRPEDHRERVRRRALQLAHRRRGRTVAAAATTLAVGIGLFVWARNDTGGTRIAVVGSPSATTTTVQPTSTVDPSSFTTATSAATPPTSAPDSTATSAAGPTTTTVPPDCTSDQLDGTTTTDKPAYATGETVTIAVVIHNHSGTTCQIRNPYSGRFGGSAVDVTDTTGNVVWRRPTNEAGVAAVLPPTVLAPDASYTWSTDTWDQHRCPSTCSYYGDPTAEGPSVAAGTYQALPNAQPPVPATPATFQITG